MRQKKTIFVIYTSQDNELLLSLLLYLKQLEDEFSVVIGHDDPIYPGKQWKPKNGSQLNKSDIFLLLVSKAFMHSEFIKQDAFKMIIDRYKAGKSMVIPILVDDCPWDIDFESDDYNFNLKELHVLPEEGKPITDWNSADQVFMQVVYHLKKVIASFTDMPDQKKLKEKPKRKTTIGKREEQIALNFTEEKEANTVAQEEIRLKEKAETIKRIEEEKRRKEEAENKRKSEEQNKLREEAETKKRVAKEKMLKEEAEVKKRVEEAKRLKEKMETKRRAEQETLSRVQAEAKKKSEEENREEIAKPERAFEQEKRPGEDVATQRRVIRKNRLTGYNYRFKSAKAVEAKKIAIEEKWENEEVEAKGEIEEKNREEIAISGSETLLEKRRGEGLPTQPRVIRKNRLAAYNYQFKTAQAVEVKEVTIEENLENEEAEAKKEVKEKSHVEIAKPESEPNFEKRVGEVVALLKRVLKKNPLTAYIDRLRTAKAVKAKEAAIEENRENEEVKAKEGVGEKSHDEIANSENEPNFEKRVGEVVAMLKRVLKKNPLTAYIDRLRTAKEVEAKKIAIEENPENKEVKAKSGTKLEKRLGEVVAMLKSTLKKTSSFVRNYQFKSATDTPQGPKKKKRIYAKGRILPIFVIAALVACGLLIYVFTGDSQKESTKLPEIEAIGVDSETVTETTIETEEQGESFSKLAIGDTYEGGIVFAIDESGKKGKIAYRTDAGPMPWKNAMSIHEQLGEGWRLPTLDELRLLYRTIGQGATNSGQFADKLYWSATPYDTNQARLLRFSDGNTSFHYNKKVAHRKFSVRAIRDFGQ